MKKSWKKRTKSSIGGIERENGKEGEPIFSEGNKEGGSYLGMGGGRIGYKEWEEEEGDADMKKKTV